MARIGVDLCSIKRIKKALEQVGFKKRVFTDEEIAYANNCAAPEIHYAAAFAAREALAKALGWGLAKTGINSASVTRTEHGPEFVFTEDFSAKLKSERIKRICLSISHEDDIAVAVVMLECEDNNG